MPPRRVQIVTFVAALAAAWASSAQAQLLPTEPVVFGDGRVTVSGTVSATFSCAHAGAGQNCDADRGYFNYTDYDDSLLRLFRVDLSAAVKASSRVSVLTEVRTLNLHRPEPYALYVRVRPWTGRRFDVQAGRIPPTFGAFARRSYPSDNLLVGTPLAYHYLVSLRSDALPRTADELIGMRGRGWLSNFSVGNTQPAAGVPLMDSLRWDTGVQAHAESDLLDGTIALTTGTLAEPKVRDNNAGPQLSARVGWRPIPGLSVGASGASGPFASRATAQSAGLPRDDRSITQTAWGFDLEYSRDHYLIRSETILSQWRLPQGDVPRITQPLRALGTTIEGRYKIRPGFYAAARWDHLGFSRVTGSAGPRTWEAPVTRVEGGVGYSLQRNLILKASYQHNRRDGGRIRALTIGAAQLVFFF